MAAAYAVADGGPMRLSPELNILAKVNRYGAIPVFGGPMSAKTIYSLELAEQVTLAHRQRAAAGKSWADWAEEHPEMAGFLAAAEAAAIQQGYLREPD